MTEDNSFGNVATEPKPAAAPAAESTGRNNRPLFIVGGVAVVVLAVFAYLLFGRGGGTDESLTGTVPTQGSAPVASAPAADPAKDPTTTPKSEDVDGRNPFTALLVEPPADDNGGSTVETGGGTTTDPTAGTDPSTTTPPPTTPTTPAAPTVTVKLVSVKGDVVATKVGNVNYTGLAAGDTFGTSFQVYAIFNDKCAGFLYGDQSFALCEGGTTTLTKL